MAPIKRKGDVENTNTRPEKRPKPSPSTPKLSVLREEEPAFPRGGASILTPLEHKQIQIQAKQDVLFEQSTGKKPTKHDFEDEENEEDEVDQPRNAPTKTKRNSKSLDKKGKGAMIEEKNVRIEGLSYKRLVPGSMVLGQISKINRYDIALALPNNLTGFIPCTSISAKFIERMEALVGDEPASENHEYGKELDLRNYFSIGQYLRAYVTSTQAESSSGVKGKRHIDLSINPQQANLGLSKADLVVNSMVQAAVLSVEDHGLIMDLGLEDTTVRGFMSSKEVGPNIDISKIEEGAVYLCLITGMSSNGNIIKLSADPHKAGNLKKGHYLIDAPTVDSFLPGTAIEILVSEVTPSGIAGKAMGMLDVTADFIHSGAAGSGKDLAKKYTNGSKVKGRIVCTFPTVEEKKLGVSLLDHVISLNSDIATMNATKENTMPTQVLPISTIVEKARVAKVEQGVGLLVDVGVKGVRGFVHISRIIDGKIETLSKSTGPYKVGSVHKARIIGYNPMDGLFIVSLEPKVINQLFLGMEDVKIGQVVQGTVEKLMVGPTGVSGVLVTIAEGITGLVPEVHLSDIHLQHPEKKFKEGSPVTARVLSTNLEKRQLRLTLKKTLVNSEAKIWQSFDGLNPGMHAPGTLVNILPSGAVVQFYGSVRGFLPVSEMSESYIEDPKQHFRTGQVVNVHIISVDPLESRMLVSCKDPSVFGAAQREALSSLSPGTITSGTVSEKTSDEIIVELEGSGLKAILAIEHLADGSAQKSLALSKKIRVGQIMKDLVILSKQESKRLVKLTSKPTLVKAAKEGTLLKAFDGVVKGAEVSGFVNNITLTGVYVQFAGDLTGLLLKAHVPDELVQLPDFGMRRHQSISTKILTVDHGQQRFLLTLKPLLMDTTGATAKTKTHVADTILRNPVDEVSTTIDDFAMGLLTMAKVMSIKETQLNVQLADGVQGRIDVSEMFDTWEAIKDRKHPLKSFRSKQILPVRIIGMHDSRNHRFLPITNRGKAPVFELTAKPSNQTAENLDILTLDKVKVGSFHIVFVNNVSDDCIWVNVSPNVRGRIRAMDVSDDISLLKYLVNNFPVGSALRATVLRVDVTNSRLDLSARSSRSSDPLSLKDLAKGMVLPGRVTKVSERQIMVQLSETLSGPVHLIDIADDYSIANPTTYEKNQTVRVCVKDVDAPNKRITLSTRPSKVLSSSLPVIDPEIASISQLKVNDVFRGFVRSVADNGLFITLASNVTAFVKISDLSDLYIKDWRSGFEVDQLVKGKIIAVDPLLNHVQMSLKLSHIDKDYQPPMTFTDIKVGQILTGKIRKVEEFGVFIVIDNSANVSGLCHRSQMADQKSPNPKKLYNEGDIVKAKILKIDQDKRQISLGLKASFFEDDEGENADESDEDMLETKGVTLDDEHDQEDEEGEEGIDLENVRDIDSDAEMEGEDGGVDTSENNGEHLTIPDRLTGLSTGGFDWTGETFAQNEKDALSETDGEQPQTKKKRRRKAEIKIDRTGDLDANGPQSIADFERLLMGQPNSSILWLSYMAFQLQLSEVIKAREIAERAIRTINIREESEKMNVWVALLNLENAYGTDDSLEAVFQRACQYNDAQEIHERLISIHIQSGNNNVSSSPRIPWLSHPLIPNPESRHPLPNRSQKILPNPLPLAQLRHLPLHHPRLPRPRPRPPPPRLAIPLPPHSLVPHHQIRSTRIQQPPRLGGKGQNDVRGLIGHVAETVGSVERAARFGDEAGGSGAGSAVVREGYVAEA